jgi:protoheme IX farnesyltransferase
VTAVDPRPVAVRRTPSSVGFGSILRAYVALTKPRIIELLLVTTLPVMVLAARGVPPLGLVMATLVGGTLAAAGAHAINQVLERDIDAVMHRTRRRPITTHVITPRAGVVFALVLLAVSTAVLLAFVNVLAAGLTLFASAFYVFVYTVLLKRRTAQNIVWGGAAGCMPTLIGWAAVTGSVSWPPVILFLVVFFWTPPHYWPLAMKFRADYARAGVPMLPVVASETVVARRIVLYCWAMVVTSLLLWPVAPMNWLYPLVTGAAGVWYLTEAHQLYRRALRGLSGSALRPMRLFHGSITYLSLVFLAVAADVLLLG